MKKMMALVLSFLLVFASFLPAGADNTSVWMLVTSSGQVHGKLFGEESAKGFQEGNQPAYAGSVKLNLATNGGVIRHPTSAVASVVDYGGSALYEGYALVGLGFKAESERVEGLAPQEVLDLTVETTSLGHQAHRVIGGAWAAQSELVATWTQGANWFKEFFVPEGLCGAKGGFYALQVGLVASSSGNSSSGIAPSKPTPALTPVPTTPVSTTPAPTVRPTVKPTVRPTVKPTARPTVKVDTDYTFEEVPDTDYTFEDTPVVGGGSKPTTKPVVTQDPGYSWDDEQTGGTGGGAGGGITDDEIFDLFDKLGW